MRERSSWVAHQPKVPVSSTRSSFRPECAASFLRNRARRPRPPVGRCRRLSMHAQAPRELTSTGEGSMLRWSWPCGPRFRTESGGTPTREQRAKATHPRRRDRLAGPVCARVAPALVHDVPGTMCRMARAVRGHTTGRGATDGGQGVMCFREVLGRRRRRACALRAWPQGARGARGPRAGSETAPTRVRPHPR